MVDSVDSAAIALPPIRRARGFHLYDHHGRRYLDLCLAGGRAILGHRPERVLLELRNLTSRGLLGDLPSVFEGRLRKALLGLIPDHPIVRVFANEERLLAAVAKGGAEAPSCIDDLILQVDAARGNPTINPHRWRPFIPRFETPGESVLVPVLPFPASFAPAIACFRGLSEDEAPDSDRVSPALLGGLTKAVYELHRLGPELAIREHPAFEAPWWTRRGPYLVPTCEKGEYSEIFRRLLEKGIYINPEFPGPSIVPFEYSEGELKPLRELAGTWAAERKRA